MSLAEERAHQELADTKMRLLELQAERDGLRFWQRDRRSAVEEQIRGHERAAAHWQERSEQLADARLLADEGYGAFMDEHGERFADMAEHAQPALAEPDVGPAPIEPADVGIDLGP